MRTSFIPSTDAALAAFSVNFNTLISATPTVYGITAPQATAFATLNNEYVDALQVATEPSTRTKGTIAAKNTARTNLIASIRFLAKCVEGQPTVTDQQKIDLGLTVGKQPTPIPPPTEMPNLDIVQRVGTTVQIKLHDGTGSRRGKPAGVQGASLFTYVGATAPLNVNDWVFQGNTTKTIVDVDFSITLPPGTVVWFTAFWYSPRGQSGPGCAPVSAILAGGAMQQAA